MPSAKKNKASKNNFMIDVQAGRRDEYQLAVELVPEFLSTENTMNKEARGGDRSEVRREV